MTDSLISTDTGTSEATDTVVSDVSTTEQQSNSLINPKENNRIVGVIDNTEAVDEIKYAGKYGSVEDLEKGYKELVQKLTEKNPKAPEKYTFDFTEDEDLKDLTEGYDFESDPLFSRMSLIMKEKNISQDTANALIREYLMFEKESIPDVGEEQKKLGHDGQRMISEVEDFVSRNYSAEEQDIARQIASTAEGVKFLHKTAQLGASKSIPTSSESTNNTTQTSRDLFEKANEIRRELQTNPYSKELERQYNEVFEKATALKLKGR